MLSVAFIATVAATAAAADRPPRVIIDCDPGGLILTGLDVDDDLAVLAAISLNVSGHLHVLGLTTTAGNAQVAQSHADALELRARVGMTAEQLPIHQGARWWPPPWDRVPGRSANHIDTPASRFIIDTVMSSPPQTVSILCLGPLANIAAALDLEPRVATLLKSLVIMGGVLNGSRLDFNFRFDRTAAAAVMQAAVPKLLVPVETAVQAAWGSEQRGKFLAECCSPRIDQLERRPPFYDPNLPATCSLSTRLTAQSYLMPWLVNGHYADISPHSAHLSDGFILWDVVALFALAQVTHIRIL